MRRPKASNPFRVVAIVSAYNEADIISPVIGHLVENGVEVYLIDNRSTDATVEQARPWLGKGLLEIEEFPKRPPKGGGPPPFDWTAILKRKEELAKELKADWFIHHDADEFREAPWPGVTLKDAIRWVDRLGFNCISFRVLNFPPVDNDFRPGTDPREHFTRWEEPIIYDTVQRKCWKNTGAPVSLAASGGHEARFAGRRVFPIKFLLRHYPIRSQKHGRRKVFEERKKRFLARERSKGWHVQYDDIEKRSHSFLADPASLRPYDGDQIRLELLLHNRMFRKAVERARTVQTSLEKHEQEAAALRSHKEELERHAANLQSIRANLERHAGQLEGGHAELERHAKALEKERERLTRLLGNMESGRGELERHAKNVEKDRERLAQRVESLEAALADRERHVKNLESSRGELERYAKSLEEVRESLTLEISELRGRLADRERHAANLESSQAAAEDFAKKVVAERDDLALRVAELGRSVRDREEQGRTLETSRAELERYARNLEKEQERLGKLIAKLESERAERERHVASVEGARKEVERHVGSLQSFLAQRDRELASLESMRAESERHAKSLEEARTELERRVAREEGRSAELERSALLSAEKLDAHARELESRLASALERARDLDSVRSDLERRNRSLAAELEAIRNSTTWRWSAPLRRLVDALRAGSR